MSLQNGALQLKMSLQNGRRRYPARPKGTKYMLNVKVFLFQSGHRGPPGGSFPGTRPSFAAYYSAVTQIFTRPAAKCPAQEEAAYFFTPRMIWPTSAEFHGEHSCQALILPGRWFDRLTAPATAHYQAKIFFTASAHAEL